MDAFLGDQFVFVTEGQIFYRWKGDDDHCPLELDTFVERYKPFARRCCLHLQDKTDSESISLLY